MLDFLLNFLEVNEGVNYAFLISLVVAYFFIIWFIICIWIFNDARKRYPLVITPLLFTLFVFFFGPPALIFYIMVRPEHTLEEEYFMNMSLGGEREARPIYFDGNKGFDISINFSVQPKQSSKEAHKMTMNVEWAPRKEEGYQVVTPEVQEKKAGKQVRGKSILEEYKEFANSLWEQLKGSYNNFKSSRKRKSEAKVSSVKEDQKDQKGKKSKKELKPKDEKGESDE